MIYKLVNLTFLLYQDEFEDDDYEEMEEEEDDEDDEEEESVSPVRNTLSYDPETQKLVDVFEEAEKLYNEAKNRHDGVKRQLEDLEKLNKMDFGKDEEFYVLKGQCFERQDEQYKYKLCPFDRSDQDGTNIGKWDKWEVNPGKENEYKVMLYNRGNSCWQGPQRSTIVEVSSAMFLKFLEIFLAPIKTKRTLKNRFNHHMS